MNAGPTVAATSSERFQQTHWSVLALAARSHSPAAEAALNEICLIYWQPIFRFIRSHGFPAAEAEDVTQMFWMHLIASGSLRRVERDRGRFRSYLLGALKHFLSDYRDRRDAAKRGGGMKPVCLDDPERGSLCANEPMEEAIGDAHFDREWAIAVVDRAVAELRSQWVQRGRGQLFEALAKYLVGDDSAEYYDATAARLGISLAAVKTHIHRLRKEYREFIRREVGRTVTDADAVEAELRYLCKALQA
ncbi:MAG TPA: hypothetical protein VIT91_11330 [Chthoniobacterales bacterium]